MHPRLMINRRRRKDETRGIVIDVGLRLRRSLTYWAEVSADMSVLLVHIGMQPMIRRYMNGQLLVDATGVPACRALLISPSAQFTDRGDGRNPGSCID
jgi:hypothetical protein